MVAGKDICLRRLAKGVRAREVQFNRFLGNAKVTTERVIESWSEGTVAAVEGRHVLAIQDTSEINFATTAERRRGLGEIGHGNGRGVLLHPMLAADAENGSCLGLLSGQVWTRKGRRTVSHDLRGLSDKESQRWIATALAAKPLLAKAAMVTVLGDRESDIFALYASAAKQQFHVIARTIASWRMLPACMRPARPWPSSNSVPSCCLRGRSGLNGSRCSTCASARWNWPDRKPSSCAICRKACR
jgi:hypothetical protein